MASVMGICGGLVEPKSENVEIVQVFKAFFEGQSAQNTPPPLHRNSGEGGRALALCFAKHNFGTERTRPTRACGHKGRGPIYPLSGCGPRPWYGTTFSR